MTKAWTTTPFVVDSLCQRSGGGFFLQSDPSTNLQKVPDWSWNVDQQKYPWHPVAIWLRSIGEVWEVTTWIPKETDLETTVFGESGDNIPSAEGSFNEKHFWVVASCLKPQDIKVPAPDVFPVIHNKKLRPTAPRNTEQGPEVPETTWHIWGFPEIGVPPNHPF